MKINSLKVFIAFIAVFSLLTVFGGSVALAVAPCESCGPEGATAGELICENGKWRGCASGGICNPLKACDLVELIDSIIKYIFILAIVIAPIMIIIAGFYFLTSGGQTARVQTGWAIIRYAVIGLVIVLLARGLIKVIEQVLLKS